MNLSLEGKAIFERFKDLTQPERFKAYQLLERSIYEESLYLFAHALGYSKIDREIHGPVIQVLESKARRKLIVLPRGCFKSTIGSVIYPIWRHIKNPNRRIIIDSELLTNSAKFLREIEGHLLGPVLTGLYGPLRTRDKTWNSTEIITGLRTDHSKKEASFTVSGVGSQRTGNHFDLAILDDVSTRGNTQTPEIREKVINHYRYYTSLLDPEDSELVVIGTRYHSEDLIGWIIENELDQGQKQAIGF